MEGLLHGGSEDLVGGDFDFDSVRRTEVATTNDGAADESVAGSFLELQRIEDGVAAGIDDHRVPRGYAVLGRELGEFLDVFKPGSSLFQQTSGKRAHLATLFVAAETLAAGGILAIVVLHMLAS